MTDETVDPDATEIAEWKARALARSDRPDIVEAAPWPDTLTPDAEATS